MKLKFLDVRKALIQDLKDLGNRNFQKKNWHVNNDPFGFWANILPIINFFVEEEIPYENEPSDQIGYTVYNQEELGAILLVAYALRQVVNKIGCAKTDNEYINSPYWEAVIQAAQHAYKILYKNELP